MKDFDSVDLLVSCITSIIVVVAICVVIYNIEICEKKTFHVDGRLSYMETYKCGCDDESDNNQKK